MNKQKHYKKDSNYDSIRGLLKSFVLIAVLSFLKSFSECSLDFQLGYLSLLFQGPKLHVPNTHHQIFHLLFPLYLLFYSLQQRSFFIPTP